MISKINIQSTLKNTQETDISYFGDDKTMHLTDISDLYNQDGDDDASDKTVIVRANQGDQEIDTAESSMESEEDSPLSPKIVENPHKSARYENLGPGVTLKDRFVLLEKLGQGDMGVVFKVKDLLKVEAQDKDPYVAIKVLTDAFNKYSGVIYCLAARGQQSATPGTSEYRDCL